MESNRNSLESRKIPNEFKTETSKELDVGDAHLYNLRSNLSTSDSVTAQIIDIDEKTSRKPNFPFFDYLGKGF